MPRPNKARTIGSERALAERIAYEREQRAWSLEGLADRLTRVGCSIAGSAIYKIEKGDPPRRISVDELVAFAQVFDVPLNDLLTPVAALRDAKVSEQLATMGDLTYRSADIAMEWLEEWARLYRTAGQYPDLIARVDEYAFPWDRLITELEDDPAQAVAKLTAAYLQRIRKIAEKAAKA